MSTDHAEDDADVMQQDDAYDESHMDEEVNYDEGEPEACLLYTSPSPRD